jgi:outer membrane protein assembly factor BamB
VWTGWTSPVVVKAKDGQEEIVFSTPGKVSGYDPADGKELWHCAGIGEANTGYTIATPAVRGDVVYVAGGGAPGTPPATLAVRAGGRGDVTKTHVLWRQKAGTGISSPVVSGDRLCLVAGTATCLNLKDGSRIYSERLNDARGDYVSPVAAGGKVFALTRMNGLYVLAGGAKFEQLAHNTFDDDPSIFNASPAISDGRLYLRSNAYLYCVGRK